jgi:hypothetical protein
MWTLHPGQWLADAQPRGLGRAPEGVEQRAATGYDSKLSNDGQVAQLVEQRTENPRVGSSILPLATL